jgi:hypothetical protein
MDMQQMLDEYAVRSVRQRWAFARDHGEWETMRACFHPDATVRVLWYSGPVAGFLDETIKSFAEREPGGGSKHWFGNSRVWVKGDRALLETDAQVLGRNRTGGYLFDFTLFIRLYDRIERRQGEWRILRMDAIYDRDRLDPVIPGSVPADFFAGDRQYREREKAARRQRGLARRRVKPPYLPPLICRIKSCDARNSATDDSRCGSM